MFDILTDLHDSGGYHVKKNGYGFNDMIYLVPHRFSTLTELFLLPRDHKAWSDEGWAWYESMSSAPTEPEAGKAQACAKGGDDTGKGEGEGEPGARSTARPVSYLKPRFVL